eukprot:m.327960 g.327960  ORF g.327960 m.327960 type:complete len:61 (-) comp16028_c3_seq3:1199-1381(-)
MSNFVLGETQLTNTSSWKSNQYTCYIDCLVLCGICRDKCKLRLHRHLEFPQLALESPSCC